ncbi:hypothetical protein BU16DRAFT_538116 [Lophium mytilinum]|uniref:Uncharacterized protein n=1 Tax=Lophium mytilinum TaxID=390894 RepID=A0A6A6QX16_9PEZI|nr:hypothetical protein BU16DRAFT_538116 [Lophium mytilinum]
MAPKRLKNASEPAPMPTRRSTRIAKKPLGPLGPPLPISRVARTTKRKTEKAAPAVVVEEPEPEPGREELSPPPIHSVPSPAVTDARPAAVLEEEEKTTAVDEPAHPQTPPPPPKVPNWGFSVSALITDTVRRVAKNLPFPALKTPAPTTPMAAFAATPPPPPMTAPAPMRSARKVNTPLHPSSALPPARRMSKEEKAKLAYEQKDRRMLKTLLRLSFQQEILKKVPEGDHQIALDWLDRTLSLLKLEHLYAFLTNNTNRYDFPDLDEMESIPANPPWKEGQGTFGLYGGFIDDSDDDTTMTDYGFPKEFILVWKMEQLARLPHERPIKRRKLNHMTSTPFDATTPRPAFANSLGASVLRNDTQPRSAAVPSPIFDNSEGEYQGGNVFDQDHAATSVLKTPDSRDGRYGLFDDDTTLSDEETVVETPSRPSASNLTTPKPFAATATTPQSSDITPRPSIVSSTTSRASTPKARNIFAPPAVASPAAASSALAPSASTPSAASISTPFVPASSSAPESTTPISSPNIFATDPPARSSQPSWTQSPPPAPIPAHAELPALSNTPRQQASSTPTTQPAKRKYSSLHQNYTPTKPSPLRQHDTGDMDFVLDGMPTPPSDDSDQSGSTPPRVRALSYFVFDHISPPTSPH